MSIRSARFENFTVFDHAEFTFSPGVNVLIGKNGTGKTHVLKALYGMTEGSRRAHLDIDYERGLSLLSIAQEATKKNPSVDPETAAVFLFLSGVFSTTALADSFPSLKRRRRTADNENQKILLSMLLRSATSPLTLELVNRRISLSTIPKKEQLTGPALYIPPREVLSMYSGFVELYVKYRLPFDRTYYDLCRLISGPLLREVPPIFAELAKPLEAVLGGRVVLKGNGFVIERDDGELDISLEAEGLRKFAQILQLIANGSIEPGGCLFWDEPEANMNPKLVVVMKDFLIGLAKAGVQVFIATHDYLLCRELSLVSEYGADRDLVRFFCLNKEQSTDPVTVESGAVLADLQHNPIVEEFAAHYDREARLFAGTSAANQE